MSLKDDVLDASTFNTGDVLPAAWVEGVKSALTPLDRTAAEISAGVTPTNYQYPEGHVYRYGTNTTPGTTDMATAIQNAILANDFCYLPAGTYAIGTAIRLETEDRLYGDGKEATILETLVNTINAIEIGFADNSGGVSTTDSRRNVVSKMTIRSAAGVGTSNAGIAFDNATSGTTRGCVDGWFYELFIGGPDKGFKFGIYGDDTVWNNTFENIWLEDNEASARFIGSSNINNKWDRCYFHESETTTQHFYMFHGKQNVFLNCNFGGQKSQAEVETDDTIEFVSGCQGIKFVGCNFENLQFDTSGLAVIRAGDGCGIDVDSCTFVEIDASSGVTAYYMRANANSIISVSNSVTQNEGTTGTLYHFGAAAGGKFEVYDYQPPATGATTHKGLTTYADIGGTGQIRFHNVPAQQLVSPEYDLDATGTVKDVLLFTDKSIQISRVALLYTETTSGDAGINVVTQVDTDGDYTANSTISTITTEVSTSAGDKTEGTLSTATVTAGASGIALWVTATLNKTGTGKVRVIVDFWYRSGN